MIFYLVGCALGKQLIANRFSVTRDPVQYPANFDPGTLYSLYNQTRESTTLYADQTQVLYIQIEQLVVGVKTYAAAYPVKVDEFSQMTVPNSRRF